MKIGTTRIYWTAERKFDAFEVEGQVLVFIVNRISEHDRDEILSKMNSSGKDSFELLIKASDFVTHGPVLPIPFEAIYARIIFEKYADTEELIVTQAEVFVKEYFKVCIDFLIRAQ